jgi:hypothetical protein
MTGIVRCVGMVFARTPSPPSTAQRTVKAPVQKEKFSLASAAIARESPVVEPTLNARVLFVQRIHSAAITAGMAFVLRRRKKNQYVSA